MMQPPSPDQPHSILIATSSAFDLSAFQHLLSRYSLNVIAANRGDTVLTAVMDGGVAMVLLDVTLAGSAGFELCQRLTSISGRPLPVLLLSAAPSDDERHRAFVAGARDYLPLPLQPQETAQRILVELGVLSPPPVEVGNPQQAGMEVNYHTMMAASPDAVLLVDMDGYRIIDVNRRARMLFGLPEEELLRTTLPTLYPPAQPDGRTSAELVEGQIAQVLAGDVRVFEATFLHSSGRQVACELRMVQLKRGERRLMHMRIVDITARKQAEALRDGKNELMEMIARGAPLSATLDKLVLLIESQSEGVQCSILLLDEESQTVTPAAGPNMPPDYMEMLRGARIGPATGSCGTAMWRKEPVVVADVQTDPLWADYKELAAHHGLRACWAVPILHEQDKVLGSFAMYYREVRSPTADDLKLIHAATHLAGIAISTMRREEELKRHRDHLEELVAARTAELLLAKEHAERASEELSTALHNLSMTQGELVRRDKLAALGALVAGVAHELNTPIGNSLMMASSMSERTAELRHDLEAGLRRSVLESYVQQASEADEVVLRNLNRAAELVASFKHIAVDAASSQRRQFVLDQQVDELAQSMRAGARQLSLTVKQDIAPNLSMDSYPGPLSQALANLFENSLVHGFAGRSSGTVTIRARSSASGGIALSLEDDGVGIPAANLGRIYDPFFTTRLGSGGSGLGLYITHNIVCGVLGGRIEACSEEGKGTTFTLWLPATAPL